MDHQTVEKNVWQDCINACWAARNMCQKTLFGHCIVEGGLHHDKEHIRTMMDCIQMCQTLADALVRSSTLYAPMASACASICDACAENCEETDIPAAAACRACATACRELSLGGHDPLAAAPLPPAEEGDGIPQGLM